MSENNLIDAARQYHSGTKHSHLSVRLHPHALDWENKPLLFKIYPTLEVTRLPRDFQDTGKPALSAIAAEACWRHFVKLRSSLGSPITVPPYRSQSPPATAASAPQRGEVGGEGEGVFVDSVALGSRVQGRAQGQKVQMGEGSQDDLPLPWQVGP